MKEPASEDEDADEDELSKNLSDARIKSEMIKTEPLSPTLSIPASPTYVAVKSEPIDGVNSNRKRKADPNGSGTKICLKFQIENSTKPLGTKNVRVVWESYVIQQQTVYHYNCCYVEYQRINYQLDV